MWPLPPWWTQLLIESDILAQKLHAKFTALTLRDTHVTTKNVMNRQNYF